MIITLNAAFCERFRRVCPPSDELERECGKVGRVGWALGMQGGTSGAVLLCRCFWGILASPVAVPSLTSFQLGKPRWTLRPAAAQLCRPAPPARSLQAEQMLRDYDEAFKELETTLPDPCRDTGAVPGGVPDLPAALNMRLEGLVPYARCSHHQAAPGPADDRCGRWAAAGECEKNQVGGSRLAGERLTRDRQDNGAWHERLPA